jgi:hypothetical protein
MPRLWICLFVCISAVCMECRLSLYFSPFKSAWLRSHLVEWVRERERDWAIEREEWIMLILISFFYCELSFINHDNAVLVIINKGEVKKIRYNFEFLFVISIFHRSLAPSLYFAHFWLVVGPIETIIIWFQYNLFPSRPEK